MKHKVQRFKELKILRKHCTSCQSNHALCFYLKLHDREAFACRYKVKKAFIIVTKIGNGIMENLSNETLPDTALFELNVCGRKINLFMQHCLETSVPFSFFYYSVFSNKKWLN